MNHEEFELFVLRFGKDILRFCRMTAKNTEAGDELYQDTMLKLLEKRDTLDFTQNTKSYALSTSIFLWKNKQKKYAARMKLAPMDSTDEMLEEGKPIPELAREVSPEQIYLQRDEVQKVQQMVASLPEKYRVLIYLFYSANLQIKEIAETLHLPEGTVKSRMRKAKKMLKEELEAIGYDR